MGSSRTPSLRKHLVPHQKLWVNWDGVFLMGPRYLRFLAAVDRTGTIRAAGQMVGWSYRTCLNRIRQMERVLGARVLATTRGGRERPADRGSAPSGPRLRPLAARSGPVEPPRVPQERPSAIGPAVPIGDRRRLAYRPWAR